jgi:hypothetical protein
VAGYLLGPRGDLVRRAVQFFYPAELIEGED